MLDVAVSFKRYRFLGNEFLTWLWFGIENQTQYLKKETGFNGMLEIGNCTVFENRNEDNVKESVTIKGDAAGMEEGMLALKKGAMVSELNLLYKKGEQRYQFTIKGESFHLTRIQFPEKGTAGTGDETENHVLEKALWCDNIYKLLDKLFQHFIKLRITNQWESDVHPKIRKWIESSLVF